MSGGIEDACGTESGGRLKTSTIMMKKIFKRATQLGLVLVCMTCLTSCGIVTGVVGFLVSLPIRVFSQICP